MSPTAFISAMTSSGGNEATCRSFADETIKTIEKTVTSTQGEVDAIETGHHCEEQMQDEKQAEKAKIAAARLVVQNAKADVASKTIAKDTAASATYEVTFDLMSTSQPNCLDVSSESSYLAVKNTHDTAIAELEAAMTALTAAETGVTAAEKAFTIVAEEASRLAWGCMCRIHKEQRDAWAEVSTATAAHAADWKSAHEVICALDKTATCTVPSCPTVTQPTLAAGVATADSEHCTPEPTNAPTLAPCNRHACSWNPNHRTSNMRMPFCAQGYCCANNRGTAFASKPCSRLTEAG